VLPAGSGFVAGSATLLVRGPIRPSFWSVVEVLLLLLFLSSLFGRRFIGTIEHVQIYNPEFEQRIRIRYQFEIAQFTNLGFTFLFSCGEAIPLIRLLLLFPALVVLMMWLKREVMTIHSGTKFLTGYAIFVSGDKTAYAEANGLGVKFRTAFQDGSILMTKNYGDATGYAPIVVVQGTKNASISDLWIEHQRRTQTLEAEGKRIDRQISFQAFAEISHKETAV
jgi:hypothetical protein